MTTEPTCSMRSDDWCDNCGLCCMHMRTPPHCVTVEDGEFVHPVDAGLTVGRESDSADIDYAMLMSAPEQARREALDRIMDETTPDGTPCAWLDPETKRCRWYRHRPLICREFEVGNVGCREHRTTAGLTIEGMPVVEEGEA